MSGALETAREALAAYLTAQAGLTVNPYVPESLAPPCGFLEPGEPYLEPSDARRCLIQRLAIVIVEPKTPNAAATAGLEETLLTVLAALANQSDWWGFRVRQPEMLIIGGAPHLAASIEIATEIHL
ncbi:MAG: hypothetical protein LBJ62_05775 [Bifidobacteriaceae bacterium]|jgi:hypothetical protein|nr:hypothetical protein [Bifidobacteriaceae bacterium]